MMNDVFTWKTTVLAFFRSKVGILSLLVLLALTGCLLLWNIGGPSPQEMEQLANRYYEAPVFAPIPPGSESEPGAIIRSAFLQQRWESAFYDIARTTPDEPHFAEAKYVEAHIYFSKKDYARGASLFEQVVRLRDPWCSPRALWYAALCTVAQRDTPRALSRLRVIAQSPGHPMQRQALALLRDLK
jgi:hypothetical protein